MPKKREKDSESIPASRSMVATASARIAWIGLAVAVLIAGVVLLSATGRATVSVTLSVTEHEQPVVLRVGDSAAGVAPEQSGVVPVPGEIVESTGSGQAVKSIQATQVLPGRASGSVTIINTTSRAQPLVATTRLLTPKGVLFRISTGVVVPARGRVEVRAAADQIGVLGDVGPTRWTIPGLSKSLQPLIYGQSNSPMTGGSSEVRRVDAVDIAEVVARAEIEASRVAENSVTVAPTMFRFSRPTSSVRELNAKAGGNVGVLRAQVRATVTHVLVDPQAASEALRSFLEAQERSSGNDLVDVRGDVSSFSVGKIFRSEKLAELTGTVTVRTRRKTDGISQALQNEITGLSQEEALVKLNAREGVAAASIRLSPPWLWALPQRADHITVLLR